MKGETMRHSMDNNRAGRPCSWILVAVMVLTLFSPVFSTALAAEPSALTKAALSTAGIEMTVVPLDRKDGFLLGLKVGLPETDELLISLNEADDSRFLVVSGQQEAVVQIDSAGQLKIEAEQSQELSYFLCLLSSIITFANDIKYCDSDDPVCYILTAITLAQDVLACGDDDKEPSEE